MSLRSTWASMIQRCTNQNHPSYGHYGGRGIKVCKRWEKSFDKFMSDMGAKPSNAHSIDRIDNDGDYTPKNCRWATASENSKNRKRSRPSRAANPNFPAAKSIKINGHLHHELRIHCAMNRLKVGPFFESLLHDFLDEHPEARGYLAERSAKPLAAPPQVKKGRKANATAARS